MAGPQKRSRVMKEHERKVTAYHEGGHALVAAALRNSAPVTKITILPRGRALGYTMVVPENDKYSVTRNELLDQMAYAMGGRVAEELVFHDPSTGASNDIEKATGIARKMVTEFGMSERVGAVRLGQGGGEPFLGRDAGHERNYSDQIAYIVDEEVRRLIEGAHDEAYAILTENRDVLDELALELLERETLNQAEIAAGLHQHPEARFPRDLALQGDPPDPGDRPGGIPPGEGRTRSAGRSQGSPPRGTAGHLPAARPGRLRTGAVPGRCNGSRARRPSRLGFFSDFFLQ